MSGVSLPHSLSPVVLRTKNPDLLPTGSVAIQRQLGQNERLASPNAFTQSATELVCHNTDSCLNTDSTPKP